MSILIIQYGCKKIIDLISEGLDDIKRLREIKRPDWLFIRQLKKLLKGVWISAFKN